MVSAQERLAVNPASCSRRNQSALGDQRAEQQLIEQQDDDEHRGDRPADGGEVLLLDGERDVGADARQGDRGVADARWPPTATTKNQPPDMDIIMFQMSAGMANGTSSRQNRIHGPSWKLRAASTSSSGMLRSEW